MNANFNAMKYAKFQRTGITCIEDYERDVRKDYDSFKAHLPAQCTDILDIGCGLGGIDLLLYKHYGKRVRLHLLDKDGISSDLHYGYQEEASFYNCLKTSAEFLILNGVAPEAIITYDASKGQFPTRPVNGFQVIVSLISCGFHYPVTTYLDKIMAVRSGIVVLDIRKDTGEQMELLNREFTNPPVVVWDARKNERVVCS